MSLAVRQAQPDVRPLGVLALGASIVCLVLSATYFLSLLAHVVALVALPLGWLARTDERSRRLGVVALWFTGVGVVVATLVLVLVGAQNG